MTTQQLLDQAQAAYHELMTGASVVEVDDSNGEKIKFTPPSAQRLFAYIAQLKAQLQAELHPSFGHHRAGPMRPWF